MIKAHKYVQLKIQGQGTRQAARGAGFAHGVPSKQARELLERVLMVKSTPQLVEAARDQVDQARKKLNSSNKWIAAGEVAALVYDE